VKVDRYTKVVLTVIAVALSALAMKYIVAPQSVGRYQLIGTRVIDTRSGTLYNAEYPFPYRPYTALSPSGTHRIRVAVLGSDNLFGGYPE